MSGLNLTREAGSRQPTAPEFADAAAGMGSLAHLRNAAASLPAPRVTEDPHAPIGSQDATADQVARTNLDYLYAIRNELLDLEDAGELSPSDQERLADTEREIATWEQELTDQRRRADPFTVRFEELAAKVLAAVETSGTQ